MTQGNIHGEDIKFVHDKIFFCGLNQTWGYIEEGVPPVLKNYSKTIKHFGSNITYQKTINIGNLLVTIGNYGTITASSDNGCAWDLIFPRDTARTYESSEWFKYIDRSAYF